MKKKYLSLLLLPILALTACNNAQENIPNREVVTSFKELLAKQDLSPFYVKSFSALVVQNYNVFSSTLNDDTNEVDFFNYHGGCYFGYQYEVSKEQYEEITSRDSYNAFDFMVTGYGDYGLLQTASVNSYDYSYSDETLETTTVRRDAEFTQLLTSRFTNDDFQVDSRFTYTDRLDESASCDKKFNGLVEKSLLTDTISTDSLTEIFARTNLFDGPRAAQVMDGVYYSICNSLVGQSDKVISDFIINNKITMLEEDDVIKVSFHIEDENIRNTLSEIDIMPGIIDGTLFYDKESGEFQEFEYEINYMDDHSDESLGSVSSALLRFEVSGYSRHRITEADPYITPNPVIYDNGDTFVDDMASEVIPPLF